MFAVLTMTSVIGTILIPLLHLAISLRTWSFNLYIAIPSLVVGLAYGVWMLLIALHNYDVVLLNDPRVFTFNGLYFLVFLAVLVGLTSAFGHWSEDFQPSVWVKAASITIVLLAAVTAVVIPEVRQL
ncbi:MAG: hypothetical protein AAFQ66_04245 [Pseudomonadota bacterium]